MFFPLFSTLVCTGLLTFWSDYRREQQTAQEAIELQNINIVPNPNPNPDPNPKPDLAGNHYLIRSSLEIPD